MTMDRRLAASAPRRIQRGCCGPPAVALIVLHPLPTGYYPVGDAVSDRCVIPRHGWFWLQAVVDGEACVASASVEPTDAAETGAVQARQDVRRPAGPRTTDSRESCACSSTASGHPVR